MAPAGEGNFFTAQKSLSQLRGRAPRDARHRRCQVTKRQLNHCTSSLFDHRLYRCISFIISPCAQLPGSRTSPHSETRMMLLAAQPKYPLTPLKQIRRDCASSLSEVHPTFRACSARAATVLAAGHLALPWLARRTRISNGDSDNLQPTCFATPCVCCMHCARLPAWAELVLPGAWLSLVTDGSHTSAPTGKQDDGHAVCAYVALAGPTPWCCCGLPLHALTPRKTALCRRLLRHRCARHNAAGLLVVWTG